MVALNVDAHARNADWPERRPDGLTDLPRLHAKRAISLLTDVADLGGCVRLPSGIGPSDRALFAYMLREINKAYTLVARVGPALEKIADDPRACREAVEWLKKVCEALHPVRESFERLAKRLTPNESPIAPMTADDRYNFLSQVGRDDFNRILREVILRVPPATADTPQMTELRRHLTQQVNAARQAGL